MKTKVHEVLRMAKKLDDERWVEMNDVDFSVLDGVKAHTNLKKPEMWAAYSYVRDRYIEYNKNCAGDDKKVFYIEDVIACDQPNTDRYGKTICVDLDCDKPCKAIFWKAENVDATVRRNFSNYTGEVDLYKGESPIERVSLKYGETYRFKNMKNFHFSRMQGWYHLPSAPSTPGHNVYAIADDASSLDADSSLVLGEMKAKMYFKLRNPTRTVPVFSTIEDESEDYLESGTSAVSSDVPETRSVVIPSPNFRMKVRLLVIRKLTIEKDGEDKYSFSLE